MREEHFRFTEDRNLGLVVKGAVLVLFYSPQCPDCKCLPFIPVFKKLPRTVPCQFGIVNISSNRAVVEKSKNTRMPIQYVPYIVMYIDGKAVMSYDGPPDEEDIREFIAHVLANVPPKVAVAAAVEPTAPAAAAPATVGPQSRIPGYTIGKPKNASGHHRTWSNAYRT